MVHIVIKKIITAARSHLVKRCFSSYSGAIFSLFATSYNHYYDEQQEHSLRNIIAAPSIELLAAQIFLAPKVNPLFFPLRIVISATQVNLKC